jgi:hypothetical protein
MVQSMNDRSEVDVDLDRLEDHVRKFEDEYIRLGKIPRNHVWRPHRFCVQDVVLGFVVVRHSLELNCLLVDVCLITDAPDYEPGSGAKITSAFLFSEAYKCGGTLEIRFFKGEQRAQVPEPLLLLAYSLGVRLGHYEEGRITPAEARNFYLALTGFSPALYERILALSNQGLLSPESVCYAVHHGIWSQTEVEMIVFGSQQPNSIFVGQTVPEQRHLYMHDITHARSSILGGLLDKKLMKRDRTEGQTALELEDDTRRLDIQFDANIYGKTYTCDESMPISWNVGHESNEFTLAAGQKALILIRAYDATELDLRLTQDIKVARRYADLSSLTLQEQVFILVPRDFEQLSHDRQGSAIRLAQEHRVMILVCPETVFSLDSAATKRLSSSRILRQ